MSDKLPAPQGEFLLYTTEDGRTRVECRFENETIWLSQALMAKLFDRDVRTINEHLQNLYEEAELAPEATIRKFRIVRLEGKRQVARLIEHYSLEAILAVGFRVKSPHGTQFRKWANTRLQEYLVKVTTVAILDRTRIPVQIDIGFGAAISPSAENHQWHDVLGFLDARLLTYLHEK